MKNLTPLVQINQPSVSVTPPSSDYIAIFSEGDQLKQRASSGVISTYLVNTGLTTPGAAGNVMTSDGTNWTSQPMTPPSSFSLDGGSPTTNYAGTMKIDFGGVT